MKSHRSLLLAAVLVTTGLLTIAAVQAQQGVQAKPTAVAVVDLERVFESSKEKMQFDADQRTAREALQKSAESKQKAAEAMKADLDTLAPGTPAHEKKQQDLELAAVEFQAWSQYEQIKINRNAAVRIEGLYRKSVEAIDRMAREAGYDLVLYRETQSRFQYENIQQLLQQIGFRKVLYANDAIDITDQVVQRMNNEFDANR